MPEDDLIKFKRLLDRLTKLEAVLSLDDMEEVRLVWYSGGGSAIELEVWGLPVAKTCGDPLGLLTVSERYALDQGLNLERIKHRVERMNSLIQQEGSYGDGT